MAAGKVVAWETALIKVGDRLVNVPRGAAVPPGADADHVKLLEKRGAIVAGEPESGIVVDARSSVSFTAPAGSGKPADAGTPAKSASKADWKAYAIAQGMSEEDADKATRDELAAQYAKGD